MSAAIDRALMTMSLEEDDELIDLPDLPEFSSRDQNALSLVGRILNPDCKEIPDLILAMPRKWQKYDKVKGKALNHEHFQFFFKHKHDLLEQPEKGVHTFNDWALAIEEWVEKPPTDFLQYIPIWVKVTNLLMNYYTVPAITRMTQILGEVIEVALD